MTLLSSIFNATSGLRGTQEQLRYTSQNISNVNTEGYTKKTARLESINLDGQPSGVQLRSVERLTDESLYRDVLNGNSRRAAASKTSEYIDMMHDAFGSSKDGVGFVLGAMEDLLSAFEDFAASPLADTSSPEQQLVIAAADDVVERVLTLNNFFIDTEIEVVEEINTVVTEVNDLLERISTLNDQIENLTISGDDPTGLMDQRDMLLKTLSEKMDVKTLNGSNNRLHVLTGGGISLVDVSARTLSVDPAAPYNLYASGAPSSPIQSTLNSGELSSLYGLIDPTAGILSARQNELYSAVDQLISDTGTALHVVETAAGPPVTYTTAPLFRMDYTLPIDQEAELATFARVTGNLDTLTNPPFTNPSSGVAYVATDQLDANTYLEPTSALTVAQAIKASGGSLEDIEDLAKNIALQTYDAREEAEYSTVSYESLQNAYLDVSAVNLDEEMAFLIQLQQAYAASARVLQTASDLMDQLIAIVGR